MAQDKSIYEQVIESAAKLDFRKEDTGFEWDSLPERIQKAWIDQARRRYDELSPEIVELLKQLDKDIAEVEK